MSFEAVMPPYNASDPTATFLNSSCLDFLLIELVPMAYRVANDLDLAAAARFGAHPALPPQSLSQQQLQQQQQQQQLLLQQAKPKPPPYPSGGGGPDQEGGPAQAAAQNPNAHGARLGPSPGAGSAAGIAGTSNAPGAWRRMGGGRMDEDEEREAVFYRLDTLGYRVGQGLVERFSRDRPRFNDTLDVIKFLCKDLWSLVFRKQVDNLKTNHRGVYVLTDNSFRPFSRMSTEAGGQAVIRAEPFLWFPCGVVRGALAAMGINASVQAETTELPAAVFQIKTLPGRAQ